MMLNAPCVEIITGSFFVTGIMWSEKIPYARIAFRWSGTVWYGFT
jgi:hypothetical protein